MDMVDYDTPWKEILEFYLKQFLELCLPDLHGAIDRLAQDRTIAKGPRIMARGDIRGRGSSTCVC